MRSPPHTPYRAGAPRFTPSLTPISPAAWLTPDTESHVLGWKRDKLGEAERVFRQCPEGAAAAKEAARRVGAALGEPVDDLVSASALVSDDLVVMDQADGRWTCQALTLTAPTFFSIDDVFRRDLSGMHGPTPDGARLAQRIGRIFQGLRPDIVLERFNWTIQCGPERHTPDAEPLRMQARTLPPDRAEATLHLRVERQTITRLKQTGAVLFTIRVCLDPLTAIGREDRPRLARAWRSLDLQGRTYKRWDVMEPLMAAIFEDWSV